MIKASQQDTGTYVVQPKSTRLTAENVGAFRESVFELIDGGASSLAIDLSGVEFIDSTALGALVGVLKKVGNRGEIGICGLKGNAAQMFKLTRMDQVFTCFDATSDAVQSMGSNA